MEFLSTKYSLDKSKLADAINKKVAWVVSIFQLTKSEKFFIENLKEIEK